MRAAIFTGTDTPIHPEDLELHGPEPDEVVVDVTACGVCHSDLHVMDMFNPPPAPALFGHEAAGVVTEVGELVTSVAPGDHVVLAFHNACGKCFFCVKGLRNLCANPSQPERSFAGPRPRLTLDGKPVMQAVYVGGWAQKALVPETNCIKVREDAPLEKVCLVACAVMTGVGAAIHTAKVEAGADVAVIGCGGVGLNVIQGARLAGAHRIIAVDLLPSKLKLAEQFGATHGVNATEGDPVAKVKAISPQLDYAFEVIGLGETVTQAFSMVRPGGTACVVGLGIGKMATIHVGDFLQEKKLIGSYYGSGQVHADIPRLIDLYMDGRLEIDALISAVRPLAETQAAVDALKAGEVARSVIDVNA